MNHKKPNHDIIPLVKSSKSYKRFVTRFKFNPEKESDIFLVSTVSDKDIHIAIRTKTRISTFIKNIKEELNFGVTEIEDALYDIGILADDESSRAFMIIDGVFVSDDLRFVSHNKKAHLVTDPNLITSKLVSDYFVQYFLKSEHPPLPFFRYANASYFEDDHADIEYDKNLTDTVFSKIKKHYN